MTRPAQASRGSNPPPGEELGRLIETEQRLAARVEAAKVEARELLDRARAEAATAGAEAERRIVTARRDVEERLAAEYAARGIEIDQEGSRHAGRFASANDAQVEELARFALARLLSPPAGAPA